VARIRSIKPEFWTSEQVADCSPTARLLFIGMWSFCDDYGIHPASAKRLKMEVFPADSFTLDQVEGWVDELRNAGLITEYTAEGSEYWAVTGWKHQKIEKKQQKYPSPVQASVNEQSPTNRRPIADSSAPERIGEERKGEESKGEERRETASLIDSIAKNKKMPSGEANFEDKATRKARWQQKITDEILRTERPKRAELIIAAYARKEPWAVQEFESVDKRIKVRRESFGAVGPPNGQRVTV